MIYVEIDKNTRIEFPDNMSREEINKATQEFVNSRSRQQQQEKPTHTAQGNKIATNDSERMGANVRAGLTGLLSPVDLLLNIPNYGRMPFEYVMEKAFDVKPLERTNFELGNSLSNVMGLSEFDPENNADNLQRNAIEAVASLPLGFGAGALIKGGQGASKTANFVKSALSDQKALQTVGAGLAGGAVGEAQNNDMGAVGQFLAGLFGGTIPPAFASLFKAGAGQVGKVGRQIFDPEGSANASATRIIQDISDNPDDLERVLREGINDIPTINGYNPLSSTVAQDGGLRNLEDLLANSHRSDLGQGIQAQKLSNKDILQEEAQTLYDTAHTRNTQDIEQVPDNVKGTHGDYKGYTDEETGSIFRGELETNEGIAKQKANERYSNFEAETDNIVGDIDILSSRLFKGYNNSFGSGGTSTAINNIKKDIASKQFEIDVLGGENVKIKDLQELSSNIKGYMREAQKTSSRVEERQLKGVLDNLEEYIDDLLSQTQRDTRKTNNTLYKDEVVEPYYQGINEQALKIGNKLDGERITNETLGSRLSAPSKTDDISQAVKGINAGGEASKAIQDRIISRILEKSKNYKDELNPDKMNSILQSYKPALEKLGATDLINALQKEVDDFIMYTNAEKALDNMFVDTGNKNFDTRTGRNSTTSPYDYDALFTVDEMNTYNNIQDVKARDLQTDKKKIASLGNKANENNVFPTGLQGTALDDIVGGNRYNVNAKGVLNTVYDLATRNSHGRTQQATTDLLRNPDQLIENLSKRGNFWNRISSTMAGERVRNMLKNTTAGGKGATRGALSTAEMQDEE